MTWTAYEERGKWYVGGEELVCITLTHQPSSEEIAALERIYNIGYNNGERHGRTALQEEIARAIGICK